MTNTNQQHILGIPEMDEQHSYLYLLFNRIEQSNEVINHEQMKALLLEIEGYLLFHFESEEFFIRLYKAPGYTKQKTDHEQTGERFVQFFEDFEKGKLNPSKLRWFLISWLDEHSRSSDDEYAQFIKNIRNK